MKSIITADWHLRKDKPRCRLDEDWLDTQFKIIEHITLLANRYSSPITIVGDIFNTTRQPYEITNRTIDLLKLVKMNVFVYPGNHDLPYHQYSNESRSAYGILKRYFKEIPQENPESAEVIFVHELTFPSEKDRPYPGVGQTAEELLSKYKKAKWIFTGDYHRYFHYEKNHRHVINPGCITRQASDFIDYKPVVYFVDTEEGVVEVLELPETEDMVTDEYIKDQKQRDAKIESFVEMIKDKGEVTLDFIENVKEKLNHVSSGVKGIVEEVLQEVE